jgi:hypothetical protein
MRAIVTAVRVSILKIRPNIKLRADTRVVAHQLVLVYVKQLQVNCTRCSFFHVMTGCSTMRSAFDCSPVFALDLERLLERLFSSPISHRTAAQQSDERKVAYTLAQFLRESQRYVDLRKMCDILQCADGALSAWSCPRNAHVFVFRMSTCMCTRVYMVSYSVMCMGARTLRLSLFSHACAYRFNRGTAVHCCCICALQTLTGVQFTGCFV